jgi:superfamily II DNA helicase RecQ
MVATNAFGLGVDKANIRNVLHYHVPGSLEAYAQEAGRGGRDGKPARCVLLFSPDDVAIQEYFLSGTYPTKRQVLQVYDALEAFTDLHKTGGHLAEDSPPTVTNIAMSASNARAPCCRCSRTSASSPSAKAARTSSPSRRPSVAS